MQQSEYAVRCPQNFLGVLAETRQLVTNLPVATITGWLDRTRIQNLVEVRGTCTACPTP
jgi:hypothetical protein